jgi:hypothetical protein
MTPEEWNDCTDPQAMVAFLRNGASERKLRLLTYACFRQVWPQVGDRVRQAVEVAERYADGEAGEEDRRRAAEVAAAAQADGIRYAATAPVGWYDDSSWSRLDELIAGAALASLTEPAAAAAGNAFGLLETLRSGFGVIWAAERRHEEQALLLHDLFGNPFHPLPHLAPSLLKWNGGAVVKLAEAIYEGRLLPSGHLDAARLAILADMLEEAGATDPGLLGHLRGPGPHVRGCFAVDALTGRP